MTHDLRAFAALSLEELTALVGGEEVAPVRPWRVVAVPADPTAEPSEEEAEEAMEAAADDALAAGLPVVVLAADLPAGVLRGDAAPVTLRQAASFHLGDDVALGEPEAVGAPWELSWYATTEAAVVQDLLRAAPEPHPEG
ncbi:hypothetical protein SAMN05445756_1518 [Kytococcus aerolatus]|uniref:Uncharacterized protein n=1 Tax=Kytococcus aerolatus TaxID=592308 RepID=A0A212U056_9MICO|nr:hypothetical protein [Kytococcus aerolatus]SNC71516.1 hypothetical protein SAMN05445756_1518 [Kytococcus aerolatus]